MYSDRPIPNPDASSAAAGILKILQQPRPDSARCSESPPTPEPESPDPVPDPDPDSETDSDPESDSSNPQSKLQNPKSDSSSPSDYHDSYLLTRVAACNADPVELAEELGIRLELFLDWLSAPQTVKRLNTIVNARQMIEQQKEQTESSRMLASLSQMHDRAVKAKDHVEQRRAAIAYLRFANRPQSRRGHFGCTGAAPRATDIGGSRANGGVGVSSGSLSLSRFPERFRSRARFVRTVPILHEAPAILSPPTVPNPANSPNQTTIALLQRLQDSDNPCDGDGLRTLFNHFTPEWCKRLRIDNADDFACTELSAYHRLLGHNSAVLHPTIYQPAAYEGGPILHATQCANLVDLDGDLQFLTLKFRRVSAKAPWLIDDLQLKLDSPDPPPAPVPNSS